MKMIVSDYDRTFDISEESIAKNVSYVTKFMEKNLFAFATGRSYDSFNNVKEKYNLKFNYLIINHGATILKGNEILFNLNIDNDIKNEIIKILDIDESTICYGCDRIYNTDSLDGNLTKITIHYKTPDKSKEKFDLLREKYSDTLNVYLVGKQLEGIEIVHKRANKSFAIEFIKEYEYLNYDDIYTIGDSYTDFKMIKDFKGNAIEGAVDTIIKSGEKVYKYVYELIIDVLNSEDK